MEVFTNFIPTHLQKFSHSCTTLIHSTTSNTRPFPHMHWTVQTHNVGTKSTRFLLDPLLALTGELSDWVYQCLESTPGKRVPPCLHRNCEERSRPQQSGLHWQHWHSNGFEDSITRISFCHMHIPPPPHRATEGVVEHSFTRSSKIRGTVFHRT